MRSPVIATILLSLSALTACTASKGVDALTSVGPSNETTASISSPTPRIAVPMPMPQTDVESLIASQLSANPAPLEVAQPLPPALPQTQPEAAQALPQEVAYVRPQKPRATSSRAFAGKTVYRQRFRDAKPVNFGRASPKPFPVHGVDVSHWQGNIDWKTLRKQGANFAFIKATEGGKHVDRLFKKNWRAAKAAGIPTGAYHFFYWCRNAEQQADWFIRHVPKEKGSLPPVLDVEWNGNKRTCPNKLPRARVLAKMKVFLEKLEAHYGVKPIIYTAPDFYEDNLKGQFKDYSFWLRSVASHPKKRYPNRDFAFWQYSGTGLSKGVSTQIDLNVFNGSEKSWKRWLSQRVL